MKVQKIVIKGLLGQNDIDLNFRTSPGFIAIHGPNGVGKTHVMKIVNNLLSLKWKDLVTIPFRQAEIVFDNEHKISASRTPDESESTELSQIYGINLSVDYLWAPYSVEKWTLSEGRPAFSVSPEFRKAINEETGFDSRSSRKWTSPDGAEAISLSRLLERYPELRGRIDSSVVEPIPPGEKASEFLGRSSVQFIDTQRLIHETTVRRGVIREPGQEPAIRDRANRMRARISKWSSSYIERSTSLDATFASRVLNSTISQLSDTALLERHEKLMNERSNFIRLGLINGDDSVRLPERSMQHTEQVLVNEFLHDLEGKLDILRKPANLAATFSNAINSNFIGKSVHLDAKRGLKVVASSGELLDVSALSSGEQHYLVMLYDIIFGPESVTFSLLDEPEISLHPEWQRGFLNILQSVSKERGTQFLLATHSPMILGPYINDAVFVGPKERI